MQVASSALRADRGLVLEAVTQNWEALPLAAEALRQLLAGGELSATGCGALKNHIFDDDGRVAAAVEIFWLNDDGAALLATLRALGLGAAPG